MTIDHVTIAGPASPHELKDLLYTPDTSATERMHGLGGQPVNELVRALVQSGLGVTLVTLTPETAAPVRFSGPDLQILAGPYRPIAAARARDFFRAERRAVRELVGQSAGQLVHAHWTYEFALGSAGTGRKVIATAHDAPWAVLKQMPDAYRLVRALMAERSRSVLDRLTVVSPYLAHEWRKWSPWKAAPGLLPNIVRVPSPRELPAASQGQRDGVHFVTVGNDSRLKNVRSLLRAFPSVQKRLPGARLTLVGPGLGPLDALAASCRTWAGDGVRFLGRCPRNKLLAEVSRADVLVHPSREESFGLAMAEALAFGIPVVADSRSAAAAWVIGDDRIGRLVDVRRPEAIADAMVWAGLNEEWRHRWSGARRESMADRFGSDAVVNACRRLYESMLR